MSVADRLMACRPLRSAALQMSHGKNGGPDRKIARQFWYEQPEIKEFTGLPKHDIRGLSIINGTKVIGVLDQQRANKNAAWVIKCACGVYETRLHKSLSNSEHLRRSSMCQFCQVAWNDDRARYYAEHGRALDQYGDPQ